MSKYQYSSLFVSTVDENNNWDFAALGAGINKGLTGNIRLHSFQFVKDMEGVILIFERETPG